LRRKTTETPKNRTVNQKKLASCKLAKTWKVKRRIQKKNRTGRKKKVKKTGTQKGREEIEREGKKEKTNPSQSRPVKRNRRGRKGDCTGQ